MWLPVVVMLACPTIATPPVGLAWAFVVKAPQAIATPTANALQWSTMNGVLGTHEELAVPDRPPLDEISATATMAPIAWFHTVLYTWLSEARERMM
nr:hypothetical protein [uncultured Rhodoferax sp.]